MTDAAAATFARLVAIIAPFGTVGVACSGGVDSTLVAHAASEALGPERVLVLFADSCLLPSGARAETQRLVRAELPQPVRFVPVAIDALAVDDFSRNDPDRCYTCKKRIYTEFLAILREHGMAVLLDGTNLDDLSEHRPGLRAIEELEVVSPLVKVGAGKAAVREMARRIGLGNADLPADSCLATRIEPGERITMAKLRTIDEMETFLSGRGFRGHRVRPRGAILVLQLRDDDVKRLLDTEERAVITKFFKQHGYESIYLDLISRRS